MGKLILLLVTLIQLLQADINKSCLECHAKNQIPNEIIYKKYLLRYSTNEYIKEAMISYLKNPNKKNSIMPSIFFSKFPMKPNLEIDEDKLEKDVLEYLNIFDVRKRLVL